jgi:hypothetical protein
VNWDYGDKGCGYLFAEDGAQDFDEGWLGTGDHPHGIVHLVKLLLQLHLHVIN